jgi:hypothetical protein
MQRARSLLRVAVEARHPGAGRGVHAPVASQTSPEQTSPSLAQALPAGCRRQRVEQQSRSALRPVSQFSNGSITPFPHLLRGRRTLVLGLK